MRDILINVHIVLKIIILKILYSLVASVIREEIVVFYAPSVSSHGENQTELGRVEHLPTQANETGFLIPLISSLVTNVPTTQQSQSLFQLLGDYVVSQPL